MNSKYQNGKIYCIWSYETDEIYIGSTYKELGNRFMKHKNKYKRFLNGIGHNRLSFEILKYGDAEIGIIEEYPCNTKQELLRREGELQKQIKCVNKKIAGRTQKEWAKENKETIAEKQKIYYKNNKDKIVKTSKQYYENNKKTITERKKIYNKNNKPKISIRVKKYYKNNIEEIKKYRSKNFNCECGITCTYSNKTRHFKTIRHKKYLEQQQQ